eukprot:GAHX01000679.1.p1 GENE.GAHX01000679.1~~GAHX01000679.1.p1  ORF type:complete len:84 (-),score=14.05 GAHX01000679.1:35-253(-)
MDFEGKKLSNKISTWVFVLGTIIGNIMGLTFQDFLWTVKIQLASFILVIFLCIPPWPFYNSHPLKFMKEKED